MRIRLALVVLIATLPALLLAPGAGTVQRWLQAAVTRDDVTVVGVAGPREPALAEPDRIFGDDLLAFGAVALGGIAVAWLGGTLLLLRRLRRLVRRAEQLELVSAEREALSRALADSEGRCRDAGEQLLEADAARRCTADALARQEQRLEEASRASSALLMAVLAGGAVARQRAEDAAHEARQAGGREAERLLALYRASAALAAPDANRYQIVDEILERATVLVGAEAASLYRWDAAGRLLRCIRRLRVPPEDPTTDVPAGVGLAGHTYVVGAPVLVADYPGWPLSTAYGRGGGLKSGLGVPLRHAGRVIGVLVLWTYQHQTFGEDDVRLASLFADQTAAALESVRLHRSVEDRADRLRILAKLAQSISSSTAIGEIPGQIARAAARLMDATVGTLWFVDEARGVARVGAFSDPELHAAFPIDAVRIGQGGVGWVAAHHRPLMLDDVFLDGRIHGLEWWDAHGLRSFYGVPIMQDGRAVAVVALNGREPFLLDAEDRELLDIFVSIVQRAA